MWTTRMSLVWSFKLTLKNVVGEILTKNVIYTNAKFTVWLKMDFLTPRPRWWRDVTEFWFFCCHKHCLLIFFSFFGITFHCVSSVIWCISFFLVCFPCLPSLLFDCLLCLHPFSLVVYCSIVPVPCFPYILLPIVSSSCGLTCVLSFCLLWISALCSLS